jgi:hypothetical protein
MTLPKDPRFLIRPMGGRRCLPEHERLVLVSTHLAPAQVSWLKLRATRDRTTKAHLIRRAISQMMERDTHCTPDTCDTESFD